MSFGRTVVFALALAPLVVVAASPSVARAEAPAPAAGAVGLPASRASLDGPAVDVWFAVWGADGAPVTGLAAKVTASVGTADAPVEVGNGLYKVSYRAVGAGDANDAEVVLSGRHPVDGSAIAATARVPLGPSRSPRAGVGPAALVLGKDGPATVTVQGVSRAGLVVRASHGTVQDVAAMPGGSFTARLAPPAERSPRVALVTWADAAEPLARSGHLAVPMSGAIDFPVKGEPGASVLLELEGKRFGPVVLDAAGKGRVPIVAPPGVASATKISVRDGAETRESIDLKIPEARRLALYPLPGSVPADGRTVPLQVVVVTPAGAPSDEQPTFTVSAGAVGPVEAVGGGVFRAAWTLPTEGARATVTASLGTPTQSDALEVALGSALPASVSLSSTPEAVTGTAELRVSVAAKGEDGRPFGLGEPAVELDGAKAVGTSREGDGWVVRAEPAASGPVRATAHWRLPSSINPAAAVAVIPERTAVTTDGAARVELLVHAVDAFGAPVAGRKVALAVEGGGGRVEPAEVTTGPDGTARATYTAGTQSTYVGVRATSQDLEQVIVLGQFPEGRPPVPPPPHPSPRLKAVTPTLRIGRTDGGAPPVAAVAGTETITLTVRGVAAPGATVTVVASAVDGAGKVRADRRPALTTTAGTLTPPVSEADGSVSTILAIPADHTGPITLTATADGRTATAVVGGDDEAAQAWAAPPEPAPVPAPTAPAPVAEESVQRVWPWLRVRANAVAGTYRYSQSPSAEPGPLLPATLSVGGTSGGAPAAPAGVEGDVRAWLDEVGAPWLGVHGQVRGAAYSISSSAFNGTANDVLWNGSVDVVGRAPFTVAGDRYWVGAKAGYQYGDFLTFLGDLEPGSTIDFLGLPVSGLGVGPELGAEVGPVHVIAGYTLGLARGSQPYASGIDLEAGWAPVDHLFVSAGVSSLSRNAVLTGADSGLDRGSIDDASLSFKLGLGLSL